MGAMPSDSRRYTGGGRFILPIKYSWRRSEAEYLPICGPFPNEKAILHQGATRFILAII
jgi:hypothetical protein